MIDLDPAKVRGTAPSGARSKTGAMEFVAIEVPHSFFYVVVWISGFDDL